MPTPASTQCQPGRTPPRGRGFSLIELLVVIAIIAIVIAIIVPALSGARIAARKAATSAMMTEVTNAAEQFSQDKSGRMPGYFTPAEMGGVGNIDLAKGGFTAMENVLLDLIGQDAIVGQTGPVDGGSGGQGEPVGPYGNAGARGGNVLVDFDLLGTGDQVYFSAGADILRPAEGQAGSDEHQNFPDVVDAFGNPLLAWVEDHAAPRDPTEANEFAQTNSREGSARYYWASNAGWLQSTALGKSGQDQTTLSLIAVEDEAPQRLTAVLGNPNFPMDLQRGPNVLPNASRGAFVVHSAGADGVFFSAKDSGARTIGVNAVNATDTFAYAANFFVSENGSFQDRLKDPNGRDTTTDLIADFDDLIAATGN